MAHVYVGNVDPRVTTSVLEQEFQCFGDILTVTVPRKPPGGYAFVEFKDWRDALYAIGAWGGKHGWRVELSRNSRLPTARNGISRGVGSGGHFYCYYCGVTGHFARDCFSLSKRDKKLMAKISVWKPKSPPSPPWVDLPEDITAKILQKVGQIDIIENAQKVCTTWRRICKDPTMWRVINLWKYMNTEKMPDELESICRFAVDLSQGQLTEIDISSFGNEDLLQYIAHKSGQLKSLRLDDVIVGEGFQKAVKLLPLLEELHIQFTLISTKDIEIIGQCCPLLNSFTLNDRGYKGVCDDDEALAIAKNMPELRYLSLFGNKMSNIGLQAILDNCSKLETLDIRQCFNVDLYRELGERCVQQIKVFKRPNDSTEDCDWDTKLFDSDDDELTLDGFSDVDDYYDYDYDNYDDFTNPFLVDGSDDFSDIEEALFGFY